jgi:hypothetical protein
VIASGREGARHGRFGWTRDGSSGSDVHDPVAEGRGRYAADPVHPLFVDKFTDQFLGLPAVAHEVITGPIATLTQENNILRDFGPILGPTILALRHALLDLAGANCRHLNVFSYGSVVVDATAGTAIIALKDGTGQVIHDQLNPAIACTKTLGP